MVGRQVGYWVVQKVPQMVDWTVERLAVSRVVSMAAMKVALLDLSSAERSAAAWADPLGMQWAEM